MVDSSILTIFIPTFFFVSVTPGMCMTLALTMGMTLGVRKTFYMMWGELIGVALVSITSVIGVAGLMLNYPILFLTLKYAGGSYLFYLGIKMLRSKGEFPEEVEQQRILNISKRSLMIQGFITAIANPKGWAFMISLLPPFINPDKPLSSQLIILVGIILTTEFICLLLYSNGGRTLRRFLGKQGNVKRLNSISGLLMISTSNVIALS